ncbi:hypothetical protein [Saccharopolyspora rectivirgula]|nr:hypothetical protein [Saccharopolyspora rectivirgula]
MGAVRLRSPQEHYWRVLGVRVVLLTAVIAGGVPWRVGRTRGSAEAV